MSNFKQEATDVRKKVLELIHKASTSHIGSNFSCIDILTMLYHIANVPKELPPDRDRIIFSKGWAAAAAYTFLWRKGILSDADLETFGKEGGLLGLVEMTTPGIEAAGGAMGHGLPIGVGMALGAKRMAEPWKTYVLMSDGEMAIGTTWESALLAAHHNLAHLTVIVDYNKIQAMGNTNEVLNIESLARKWRAFGWHVEEVDGHDYLELELAIRREAQPRNQRRAPQIIIAHTTKGKGVSFMENKLEWHYKNVNDEDYQRALTELNGAE